MVVDGSGDEGWYRLLFERAAEAILVVQNEHVVDVNPRACMLLGRSPERVVGNHISELFSSSSATELLALISRAVEDGSARGEAELLDVVGGGALLSILASEVSDGVCLFMLRNMDEREEMEKRLIQAEKMAALGRLSAAIAHEINNPLTGITNYLALLKRHTTDKEVAQYICPVEREVERISGFVRALLEFYRSEYVVMRKVCINDAIEEVVALLSDSFKVHGIQVFKSVDVSVPSIMVSVDQIRQVLINLLVNSMDAIGENGQIYVRTSHDERFVMLSVRDTGCGISEDVLPHIFEPFFSTKRKTSGTGLGLFVSYGIVEGLGGSIEVKSDYGKGTEFSLCLPRLLSQKREITRTQTS